MKTPTNAQCFRKASQLCADINEEEIISSGTPLEEVIHTEYIFYKEGLLELIKYCKGEK